MAHWPRISLITPSFQQASFLEACMSSVHDQQYPALEHVVVDGGSTDGSNTIIERYAGRLSWWCSEQDQGQSDAINKGLQHCTGTIFGWINSDDLLLPGSLETVGKAFADDPSLVVFEGVRLLRREGVEAAPSNDPADMRSLFTKPYINQQSTFYRMDAVRAAGGVESALHYIMDLELWWRIMFSTDGKGLKVDPRPLAEFRLHAESKTGSAQERFRHEQAGVLHGMCLQCGEHELAAILAIGYQWPAGIRTMPGAEEHPQRVRDMALHFLLKWDHVIHHEAQFDRMRALLRWTGLAQIARDPWLGPRIAGLAEQVRFGSWTAFRIARKVKHLLP